MGGALLWLAAALLPAAPSFSTAAAARRAAPSGTLLVCDDVKDPMTLDPQKEFSEKDHTIVQQIFEGLVRFGPHGRILPALATSWRRLNPLTMEFTLRRGVVFQDGEPFNSDAVKFSIDRYLNPATQFPALGYISSIKEADAVAPYTVDIKTNYPDGILLNRLAGFIVIVAPRYYRKHPESFLARHPVGTGPFRFGAWNEGRDIVLLANRRYWDPARPKTARLVFKFIPLSRQVRALIDGRVDLLTSLPGTDTLRVQTNPGTHVVKSPTFYTVAANFNTSRPPLSDPKIRRAINLAVNRQDLVHYDILGNGFPVATLSLPGEFGHNAKLKPYPYKPRLARRLIAREGYPHGIDLKVLLKINAERTGKILARQLLAVGVRLHFTLVSDAGLFRALSDRNRWDMAIYDVPDPMYHAFFIRSIFLSSSSPFSLSKNAEVDRLTRMMVTSMNPKVQAAVSRRLDRYIYDHALALPTYERLRTYGLRRGVHFIPYVSGMPYFDEDWKDAR